MPFSRRLVALTSAAREPSAASCRDALECPSPPPHYHRLLLHLSPRLRGSVWFYCLASKANVADLPSRGAFVEMEAVVHAIHPVLSLPESRLDVLWGMEVGWD